MKKFLSFILGVALSFSLAACGSGAKTGTEGTASGDAAANAGGVQIKTVDDLKTLKLSAQRGTVGDSIAQDLLGERAETNLMTYEKYAEAIQALLQGKVQAVIMDEKPAERFLKEYGDKLTTMSEALSEENYAIALRKGNGELLNAVNKALAKIQSEGTLDKITEKYNSDAEVKPSDIDFNVGAAGGKLIVGTEPGFAPYELQVTDGFIGIDIELCAAIAKELGRELQIKPMAFDSLPAALNANQIDLACAGITVTDERKENMDFTTDYVVGAKQVALVLKAEYAG